MSDVPEAVEVEYQAIAEEFGIKLTPERVGVLVANEITPAEFKYRAASLQRVGREPLDAIALAAAYRRALDELEPDERL